MEYWALGLTCFQVDTDPGVDDVLAILLALASPELEILAIIVSFGNTDVHSAYANIYKLYHAVGRHLAAHPEDEKRFPNYSPDVPLILALGPDGPLEGGRHFAQYFHGRDGLSNITERHPDLNVPSTKEVFSTNFTPTEKSGVEVTLDLLESRPERTITYIVLGPPTNLALVQREHGQTLKDRIGRVIIIGGALDVPGNTTPVAEFNFFADPYAAKELLCPIKPAHCLPLERVVLTTLDITTPHELPFTFYTEKIDPEFDSSRTPSVAATKSPICHFTSSFLERTREIMVEFGKDVMELHDVVAIWCAIDNPPEILIGEHDLPTMSHSWSVAKRKFDIERQVLHMSRNGEITRGMLVVDRRDDKTAYAPGANRAEVQALLEQSHQRHGLLESTALPAQVDVESVEASAGPNGASMGVACVVQTPGTYPLLQLLTKRVWGVDVE
ncbi:nucleoside hydrolase [Phlebopus sp. FC_14]|nr:nucleoside hydrolase [Phlebopus sp. FC_14]